MNADCIVNLLMNCNILKLLLKRNICRKNSLKGGFRDLKI